MAAASAPAIMQQEGFDQISLAGPGGTIADAAGSRSPCVDNQVEDQSCAGVIAPLTTQPPSSVVIEGKLHPWESSEASLNTCERLLAVEKVGAVRSHAEDPGVADSPSLRLALALNAVVTLLTWTAFVSVWIGGHAERVYMSISLLAFVALAATARERRSTVETEAEWEHDDIEAGFP